MPTRRVPRFSLSSRAKLHAPALALSGAFISLIASGICRADAPAATQPNTAAPTVSAILARFKAVTGGAAWDSVRSEHVVCITDSDGYPIQSESWFDDVRGIDHYSASLVPATGSNYNMTGTKPGQPDRAEWNTIAEQLSAIDAAYPLTLLQGYLTPNLSTEPVSYDSADSAAANGASDVLELTVFTEGIGKHTARLWFDRASGLLTQVQGVNGNPGDTVRYLTWQKVNDVSEPQVIQDVSNGQQRRSDAASTVSTYQPTVFETNAPIPFSIFNGSHQPGPDYSFAHGVTSTTVPMRYVNEHIFIPISIDGSAYEAILDSGAGFVFDDSVAAALHHRQRDPEQVTGIGNKGVTSSEVTVGSVRIGDLTLNQPVFGSLAMPTVLRTNPFTGHELLERFVVSIDFDTMTVTFTEPDQFHTTGGGIVVPLHFRGTVPAVDGTADGLPGLFTLDTGAEDSLDFNSPFVAANNLTGKYKPKFTFVTGYGLGGEERAGVVRVKTLKLGDAVVQNRIASLSNDTGGGLSKAGVAGNVGMGALRQFNIVFDYPHNRLILTPNKAYGRPDEFSRLGLTFDVFRKRPTVAVVIPGGPADKAGIKPGDVVISVDGVPFTEEPLSSGDGDDADRILPVGSKITLKILPGGHGKPRSVTLTARDLI